MTTALLASWLVPLLLAVPPADAELPALAAEYAARIGARSVAAPDGAQVPLSTILDTGRMEHCLRTIGQAQAWPAAWLVVQDTTRPHDLVLRVTMTEAGALADPDPVFLTPRREWDDGALVAAVRAATGAKPAGGRTRNLVVQSFTKKLETVYVYDLPKTGKDAKGLMALLPEGSYLRESTSLDLGDGMRHTVAVILERPRFVPADCSTNEGRRAGHRDEGGIALVLAGETALEDRLELTGAIRDATGSASLPRLACAPGDIDPGAMDRLVGAKLLGREAVRLLDFDGKTAESALAGTPIRVGVKKVDGTFKLFAAPLTQ